MQPRTHSLPLRRLHNEDGISLVEVLVSILLLSIGVLGLLGGFDSARSLTLLSERHTAMAHRAQLEIERLQATPYEELAMISPPSSSINQYNPDYYVKSGTAPEYQYGTSSKELEKLVIAGSGECTSTPTTGCGVVSSTPTVTPTARECAKYIGACEWKDGTLSGDVYDFITWQPDPACSTSMKCTTKVENYKRLTVVVTLNVPSGSTAITPLRVSTLIA